MERIFVNINVRVCVISSILFLIVILLIACGGGSSTPTPITLPELIDPTPGTGDKFGLSVEILANGNIVVTDSFDSTVATSNGAVHLYNPSTQDLIGSIYGDTAGDQLGSSSITVLANNNFVIASQYDDVAGVVDAGSVRLIDGTTGASIGSIIAGDAALDQLGSEGITALANNNFVVVSPMDDVAGVANAGSVRLIDGTTGAPIGNTIAGDTESDFLGSNVVGFNSITELANNNFVISSWFDDVAGVVNAGSVRLIDGTTGLPIGSTIAGDTESDHFGSGSITALANNNFVIAAMYDDVAGLENAGSVRLIDGTTGAPIGSAIAGDGRGDLLGRGGITALANNNFVIASPLDDVAGVLGAGSVMLIDGTTGTPIGNTIAGDAMNDSLGAGGITALANNNFVIASNLDDVAGLDNAGSVMLIDGTTGTQISTIQGDAMGDHLGWGGITALANNNFVVASRLDSVAGVDTAGSVRLIDGTTGAPIGSTIAGDAANDKLGSGGITALANNNFVIASPLDNVANVVEAGSVRLIDGTTGVPIGNTIAGDAVGDQLGSGSITALANNNFVITSPFDDMASIFNAGSVKLIDGTTGVLIGRTIAGNFSDDVDQAIVKGSATGDFFVLGLGLADNNGFVDSGLVRLIAE